jgi:hypothetical protein
MLAKLLRLYRSRRGIDLAARRLEAASAADMRRSAPVYGIVVSARFADGGSAHGSLVLSDTYRATGVTIGVTVKHLLSSGGGSTGVALLHEAMPPADFMAAFGAELGGDLRSRIWEEAPRQAATAMRRPLAQTGASSS